MGSCDSRANRGMECSLISASRSGHGEYTLSHHVSSLRLNISYSICIPRCDIPISYTSGKHIQKRTSILFLSLITLLYSPPIYLAGFSTFISISSGKANFLINNFLKQFFTLFQFFFSVLYFSSFFQLQ